MSLRVPSDSAEQIASLILNLGLIDDDQFNSATISSLEGDKCLIETLVDFGFTDEKTIRNALSGSYDLECIEELNQDNLDLASSGLLSKKYITENRVAPIQMHDDTLDVIISEPSALNQLQSIGLLIDKKINPYLVTFSQIRDILDSLNSDSQQVESNNKLDNTLSNGIKTPPKKKTKPVEEAALTKGREYSVAVDFIDKSLKDAINEGVSDIHIEIFRNSASMRWRLDGVLMEQDGIAKVLFENYSKIVTRIKIMAKLNIAERRLAQDGAINLKVGSKEVDFRVSIMPTKYGERVVMRILDTESIDLSIEKLGFQEEDEQAFKKAIGSPQGMVLVTGPTGSGKSTTLYAALTSINDPEKNILTAEDPVEYVLDGIGQVHVNPDYGMTFSSALRSFLRQDPEVVMVGEIRDKDTVDIAIKAALTGHLVMSTLHTNDAVSTITRLMNMGVEPYLITSSLTLIVAQRLARKNCNDCIEEDQTVNESQLRAIGFSAEESSRLTLYKGKGCKKCKNTGYKGRKGIYEVLRISDNLITAILKESTTLELAQIAKEKDNFITMQQVGRMFLQQGDISLEEYKRILILD
ncbi:MAG: GspE/PulE family protein [Candidatus Pseudothioglobus sp.]